MTRLLIVDDETEITAILKDFLEYNSFECETADSVSSAKDIINSKEIDLILSDVRMPGGNGNELLQWLNDENKKIKLHFMTGFTDVPREELLAMGALGVISKPFELEDVLDKIKGSLG